ncbi:hypothetical protein FQU23_000590 [Flavobacterium sp. XN-5]|uniref:hypothetical protein n=1 Tax=Flavobacterium sp. XN-5 TaxID=2599390 RepID=UPI0011CBD010|nr:hypothetical protein [Flavobacterium sp. XN-5]NGY36009.1 hypothetical protein [Flavobacterium sp. XN-5]
MENLKRKPTTDFNWEAQWQQLYILSENWYSDLHFYKDDLRFLYALIEKYFMKLNHNGNLDEMREIAKELSQENKACEELLDKTALHLKHLAGLIDAPYKYDSHQCRNEHEKLENEIAFFVKKFRKNKKAIFSITEKVMKKEIQKRLTQ